MIASACPHCDTPVDTEIAQITHCHACSKPFICIDVYCASKYHSRCKCWNYIGETSYLGSEIQLSPPNALPTYLKTHNGLNCSECGLSWGLRQAVISQKGERVPRPFEGHLIVPLEEHLLLNLFHGTKPDYLESIGENGLRPPASAIDKSHGFATEGSLRYTGRDLAPAVNHSDSNCIVELSYSGLIAITSLTCVGEQLNLLLDKLPKNVGGVQYHEDGLSIAFRPEAELHITKMPPCPKNEGGWFSKFREMVCRAL